MFVDKFLVSGPWDIVVQVGLLILILYPIFGSFFWFWGALS